MKNLIKTLSYLSVLLGLVSLAGAGLFLAIGGGLDNYLTNYQAEILANFAYFLLVFGWLVGLISHWSKISR